MGIDLKTHKILWGRSGNKCAFEDCRNELIADETETDDESIIGEEAHIVSKSPNGPRGKSSLSAEERDKYSNLILLCRKHHKIIDDQPNFYTVDKLHEIKKKHEEWIDKREKKDEGKAKDDLIYATYIDEAIKFLDFENWNIWASEVLDPRPTIQYLTLESLRKFPTVVISRFWPGRYPELENAIFNLKNVLGDFIHVFCYHAETGTLRLGKNEDPKTKIIRTELFYKLIFHEDVNVYNRLLDEYNYHVELLNDLILELTRAGNLLIERLRKYISPMYRDKEGKLLIAEGSDADSHKYYKAEYTMDEKKQDQPYPGLKKFMEQRVNREISYGSGIKEKYRPFDQK